MSATKIFLVVGINDHESTYIIKAFRHRKRADAFRGRCDRWKERQPHLDIEVDDPSFEAEYDRWEKRHTVWRRRDPTRIGCVPDYYEVVSVSFDGVVI